MAFATGMVLIAFGASLFYKGYKGWTWSQFYAGVFSGGAGAGAAPAPLTPAQSSTVAKPAAAGAAAAGKAASTVTSFLKGG